MEKDNIWVAASDGNLELVQEHLTTTNADVKDEFGYTPMHAASSYGHLDLIKLLINKYNANIDISDEDGDTPLHVAQDLETCQLLMKLGANPNIRNNEGKLPIEVACVEGKTDIIEFLKTITPEYIHYEEEIGDDEALERLLGELQDEE